MQPKFAWATVAEKSARYPGIARHIEDTILNGKASYPVERTLLTSGMVIAGVDSLHQGEVLIETPQMDVAYQSPDDSFYWRD